MLWKADEVRKFLKFKGFHYSHNKGDDEFWVNKNIGERGAIVPVPQRNEDMIEDTMNWMIKRSNIPRKEWNNWKKEINFLN